jgi:hypothetical protein
MINGPACSDLQRTAPGEAGFRERGGEGQYLISGLPQQHELANLCPPPDVTRASRVPRPATNAFAAHAGYWRSARKQTVLTVTILYCAIFRIVMG